MPRLLQLMHDEDASCRTKALLALSCLIRLNPLALEVFRQKRGVPQLVHAAEDSDVKVKRYRHTWSNDTALVWICCGIRFGMRVIGSCIYSSSFIMALCTFCN